MPANGDLVPSSDGFPSRYAGGWSKEKLYYVRGYCEIFNTGMQYRWPTRVYIDLFSGPGRCTINPTGEEIDGSPAIAAKCRAPGFTHLFLNDMDPAVIEALRGRMASLGGRGVNYFNADCNDAAQPIARSLSNLGASALSVCFIDPTNWQIRFSTVAQLTHGRRMDLIMVFQFGSMKRVVHLAPKPLTDFFGDSHADPEWVRHYDAARQQGQSGTVALVKHYEDRLSQIGYQWFHDQVLVEKDNDGTPLYVMLFASKSGRGEDFWRKIATRQESGQYRLELD